VKKRYQEYSDKATSGQMYMFGSVDSGSHRDAQVTYTKTARVCGMACLRERDMLEL
jgi:hypothetical protein